MSYADIAAKGPKQSDAEKVPDAVPEIMHEDSGVHSLESLQSVNDHVRSLPSETSYADQQLAEERAEEARREAEQQADQAAKEAKDFMQRAEASANELHKDFKSEFKSESKNFSQKAERTYEQTKSKAKEIGKEAKKEGKKAEEWADKNKQNPVVVGNTVVLAALGVLLGTGAYRMHKNNTLTWNVVGAWAGAVGLFAVGDYYVSQYFFKKYPPKN